MQVVTSPESSVDGMSAPFCLAVIIPAYNEQESMNAQSMGCARLPQKSKPWEGLLKSS
jgi:hypothetical protein